jgi:poly-gamma-glutamate capsule biosynthesis protein CapA/YwtB (metallophosphatase superfamily)
VGAVRVDDATFRRRRLGGLVLVGALLVGGAVAVEGDRPDTEPVGATGGDGDGEGAGAASNANANQPRAAAPGPGASSPTTTEPRPDAITLAFAGDILPHMPLIAAAQQLGAARGVGYDFAPMLAPMAPLLSSADLPLCHLEVPIAPTAAQVSGYPVFGAPAELVAGIAAAGYRGCSTASNHSLDKGRAGIQATLDTFDRHGLGHTGTARTAAEAATTRIYDADSVRVAHLSYSYGFNGIPLPPEAPWAANLIDPNRIVTEARAARDAGADLVVVSLHWGTEGQVVPDAQQQAVAPVLAASPHVDLVIGHHAHVVQPIQRVGGKFVVFGLGNQLHNQRDRTQRDGLTVIATASQGEDGRYAVTAVEAVPTWMDKSGWQVVPITAALADAATPEGLRAELVASYQRTVAVLNQSGPVAGLTVDPLP